MNNFNMFYDTAYIYIDSTFAGILEKNDEGYIFTYDKEYLLSSTLPVSLTLPLRDEPYTSKTLFSFFDGLIPEGWLLDIVIKKYSVNPLDRFSLLLLTGEDTIGNVSVRSDKL